ncbi:hypothetical protein BX659_13114 [Orenia metallireducens]|jgi:hypothetical protein|uniref:SIMPL domain-containing protein n=1 Tax=Orenia metallireducens TaxID=1413210 RepID=A0A285I8H8_9FIRM|nr:SIMPL domain-containing protein [Orenia metallireducens]PRX21672.1 hypothetical protein BX659_13114 [Orenia metallireducens]SNY44280.1 hypothetical protein SAMN06265827_13414 [Orenia metallireducens]
MTENTKIVFVVSIGLIVSSLILGIFFYQAQKEVNTIKVVGLASRAFVADRVKWNITIEEEISEDNLKKGYLQLKDSTDKLKAELKAIDIKQEDINIKPVNVYKEYDYINEKGRSSKVFRGYRLQQHFYVISDKVEEIEELNFDPIKLLDKGVIIENSNLQYFYSKIDQLKKDIISEAMVNAKERANKILENTDLSLGKTVSIKSGVFQITEPYSTNVSSGGVYNTSTKHKEIRVTVHAVFEID